MYWINERCYKTLENALIAYEEYKKNERILNGEGLAPLPHNLNIHNHYQEVSEYNNLDNKITTWGTPSQINTRISTYADFGPPRISGAKTGVLYLDKHTNKMWMLNSEEKWIHIANYGKYKATAAWETPPQINKVMTEIEFIRSGRGIPPEKGEVKRVDGEIYYTVDTNQIVIKSDDNLIKLASGKVYDLPNNHNCRNCGAPLKSCTCEYCGTVY